MMMYITVIRLLGSLPCCLRLRGRAAYWPVRWVLRLRLWDGGAAPTTASPAGPADYTFPHHINSHQWDICIIIYSDCVVVRYPDPSKS